jgi:hypothetical protein
VIGHASGRDMADFAEGISDHRAGRSLARAIQGKGAFRRFKDRLHQNYPDLLPAWHAFQSIRAKRRAVQWLVDNSLVDQEAAAAVLATHAGPRPALNHPQHRPGRLRRRS